MPTPPDRGPRFTFDQIRGADRNGFGSQIQMFGGGPTSPGNMAVYNSAGDVVDGGSPGNGGVSVKTASYTALVSDSGKLLVLNSSVAITLTLPPTPPSAKWTVSVANIGAGAVTVSPNGLLVDGSSTAPVVQNSQGLMVYTDATNYFTQRGIGGYGSGGVVQASGNYTASASDNGKLICFNLSTPSTLTLPAVPPSPAWRISVENQNSAGLVTISPGSLTLDGLSSSPVLQFNQGLSIYTDGSNYQTQRGLVPLLQHGGVNNGSQSMLNIKAGTNVTITDDGVGGLTIAASAGGGTGSPGNLVVGASFNGSNSNWSNFSGIIQLSAANLLTLANSWKVGMVVVVGPAHVQSIVVKRTLFRSTTVIDTTPITVGGASSFTLSAGETFTDPVSLALDNSHDYYIIAYFETSTQNGSAAMGQGIATGVLYAVMSGDHTTDTSVSGYALSHAPSLFSRVLWVS